MADFYPPAVRSTGLGYGTGIGRFGSMAGPSIVGFFLASGLSAQGILRLPIGPALVAALCVVCIAHLRRKRFAGMPDASLASAETTH